MPKIINAQHIGFTDSLQGWVNQSVRNAACAYVAVSLCLNGKSVYSARVPYIETDKWDHFTLISDESADFPCVLVQIPTHAFTHAHYRVVGGVSVPKGCAAVADEIAERITQFINDDMYFVEGEADEADFEGSMSEVIAKFGNPETQINFN
jgi:hypothetical protein